MDVLLGLFIPVPKNGLFKEESLFLWLQVFKNCVRTSNDDPAVMLDNYLSKISLRICNYCKHNRIIVTSITLHNSRSLQPLYLTFRGPLKKVFKKGCDLYLKIRAQEGIQQFQLASMFNKASTNVTEM